MPGDLAPTKLSGRLAGKAAMITGGGGAIGVATSARLLQDGANVCLVDISTEALQAALSELRETISAESVNERILLVDADLTSESDVEKSVAKMVDKWGRLDCAFLNAGVSYASTSIFDTTEDSYERVMRINVKSGIKTTVPYTVDGLSVPLTIYNSLLGH